MISDGHANVVISGNSSTCLRCDHTWDTNGPAPPPCVKGFSDDEARELGKLVKTHVDRQQLSHYMRPYTNLVDMRNTGGTAAVNNFCFRVLAVYPQLGNLVGLDNWSPDAPAVYVPSPPLPSTPPPPSTGLKLGERYAEISMSEAATLLVEWRTKFPDLYKHWVASQPANTQPVTAHTILQDAQQHMLDRAAARDQPSGERSMERCVRAFNAITGSELSERDGWMFMVVLKATRACNTDTGLPDDYEDLTAYSALAGEAAAK